MSPEIYAILLFMRIYLDQIGCRLNYSEIDTLAGRLRAVGHITVPAPENADVIVFNSCAVTAEASKKSRQSVRKFHKANPNARIAVTGCWSTLQPQQASELPGVAMVVDNSEKELLHTLLEPWSADFDDPASLARMGTDGSPFEFLDSSGAENQRQSRTRSFIKVQDGCNNKCTFCIVTIARGDSRSRTTSDIVDEVQRLSEQGVKEAVLTGVHLGSYGRDLASEQKTDLKELTRALLSSTDIPRLRLSSLEPWELADGFFDLWTEWSERLCPHLHLPLQAGTDKQLRLMARRCTKDSFRTLVEDARAAIPNLIITTDLIVGFPGESADDFEEGLAYVDEMRFAHAHIFPFSARAGTAAAAFGNPITKIEKKDRSRRMHQLVEQTGRTERQRQVGQTRPVLWEGEGQPLTDQAGLLWTGLTDNYLRVNAVADPEIDLHNQITNTKLVSLEGDTLTGLLAD